MTVQTKLIEKMIEYYSGDPKRIQHFLKVYHFSKIIGEMEYLDEKTLFILETAAIVHDVGIKISEHKYGSSNGMYQQQEGPAIAKPMLESLKYSSELIERICYLIAHHHTYSNIDGIDYQILVEADFLVNIFEDNLSCESIQKIYHTIFKTKSGKSLCKQIYIQAF